MEESAPLQASGPNHSFGAALKDIPMKFSPLLDEMMKALQVLPGVGPKSAQRMAFTLLERERSGGLRLASLLNRALTEIGHCSHCRTFTENDRCEICANPKREENGLLCVVESPADVAAIEQTGQFSGRYFVLMGHLSPLDGIGPEELGLDILERRLQEEQIKELILATNPTIEGMPPPGTSPTWHAPPEWR